MRLKIRGHFRTFGDWVSRAERVLTERSICVDRLGNRCLIGKDFMSADARNAFPVYFGEEFEPEAGT